VLFNSWIYGVFLVALLAIYGQLRTRQQNRLLLLASYFFYGWWDWRFVGLVLLSTAVDYTVAAQLDRTPANDKAARNRLLAVSIATNLGVLGLFKYFNFFVESATVALGAIGLEAHIWTLRLILPVGISFYTFQTMAYTIDVYRQKTKAVLEFELFALYVCFFPQLVAGPIERPEHLIPQLRQPRRVDADALAAGSLLIFWGLVRKVGIADVVAPAVDRAFRHPEDQTSMALAIGVVLFSLQIYNDFAGYSSIARGTARVLGIELMENFRQPYFSTNITVFWRRWHISLSTWLRDYLYIPLGGSRGGTLLTYRNLMLTMLLGGLWHGASWNFVVWGGIHGVALAAHKLVSGNRKILDNAPVRTVADGLWAASGWAFTFCLVLFAWVFFRADTFADATAVLTGIASGRGEWAWVDWSTPALMTLWVLFLDIPMYRNDDQTAVLHWPWPVRGTAYASFALLLVLLERGKDATFIYFQF